ncbi:FKBP-type peptidyl-prolyl cis-trans isomerase N-terminal domain-containing protein [Lysobacter humi (ex Lee et al. 2017)]
MHSTVRAAVVLGAALVFAPPAASQKAPAAPAATKAARAAPLTALTTQRQKVSYMVGTDVAQSIAPVAEDLDVAEFERAIRNAFAGGSPLITPEQAKATHEALMKRIAVRRGQAPAGTTPPPVSKAHVAALVGADVGRSLEAIKDELELPVLIQAVSTVFSKGTLLMTDAERTALREQFAREVSTKLQARAAAQATSNKEAGAKFLAQNKTQKGVFTTASGLQYMVLRQGSGARPRATDRVRVNYEGRLLDGTVFDSSYKNGQPVDFMLKQVIQGWAEGVQLMPVGAKYRFWIPAELGYGERGAGAQVGPNATLVFDVELLSITQ